MLSVYRALQNTKDVKIRSGVVNRRRASELNLVSMSAAAAAAASLEPQTEEAVMEAEVEDTLPDTTTTTMEDSKVKFYLTPSSKRRASAPVMRCQSTPVQSSASLSTPPLGKEKRKNSLNFLTSWTNMDRNRKFHKVFKNISHDELLIKSFSCAYVGDILLQGFLYLSENYFCFYTKILGHSKRIQIPLDRVEKLSREKTAFIIPNAIGISTSQGEKFVFSSLLARDATYSLMTTLLEKKRQADIEQTRADENISSKVVQQGLNVSVSSSLNKTESSTSSESSIEESKSYSNTRRGKDWFKNNRSISTHTVTSSSIATVATPTSRAKAPTQTPPPASRTTSTEEPSVNYAHSGQKRPDPVDSAELRRSKLFLKFIVVMFILLVIMTMILSYKLIRLETIYERYYTDENIMKSNVNSEIYNYL